MDDFDDWEVLDGREERRLGFIAGFTWGCIFTGVGLTLLALLVK